MEKCGKEKKKTKEKKREETGPRILKSKKKHHSKSIPQRTRVSGKKKAVWNRRVGRTGRQNTEGKKKKKTGRTEANNHPRGKGKAEG